MSDKLLSFQIEEEEETLKEDPEEAPLLSEDEGITVIDNFKDGTKALNYKAEAPTEKQIEAANKLARKVFEDLGLDFDEADKEGDDE